MFINVVSISALAPGVGDQQATMQGLGTGHLGAPVNSPFTLPAAAVMPNQANMQVQ